MSGTGVIVVRFTPSPLGPFQFLATLDGADYTVIVTWNVSGRRWYISIIASDGTLVLYIPLIASDVAHSDDISLTAGYFTTRLIFRDQLQQFEIVS